MASLSGIEVARISSPGSPFCCTATNHFSGGSWHSQVWSVPSFLRPLNGPKSTIYSGGCPFPQDRSASGNFMLVYKARSESEQDGLFQRSRLGKLFAQESYRSFPMSWSKNQMVGDKVPSFRQRLASSRLACSCSIFGLRKPFVFWVKWRWKGIKITSSLNLGKGKALLKKELQEFRRFETYLFDLLQETMSEASTSVSKVLQL